MVTRNKDYYTEFIKETQKIIREQDQTKEVSDVVREIESHRSDLEEKENRIMATTSDSDTKDFNIMQPFEVAKKDFFKIKVQELRGSVDEFLTDLNEEHGLFTIDAHLLALRRELDVIHAANSAPTNEDIVTYMSMLEHLRETTHVVIDPTDEEK
ncbi:hypothetical protein LCGC14_1133640 [marine sediment metagenome]|uniref:Uncharacterized protein n=1 Tax=marine sediment metagenome TaxID=412755 RepID=A0A0F9PIP0_9ZZZZ